MGKTICYAVVLVPAEEGGFVVTMPDWPEVLTQGDNWEDAMEQVRDAFATALSWRIENREALPKASPISREKGATDETIWLSII